VTKKASTRRSTKKTAASPPQTTGEESMPSPAKRSATRKRASQPAVENPFTSPVAEARPSAATASADERPASVFSPVFQAPDPVAASAAPSITESRRDSSDEPTSSSHDETPGSDSGSAEGTEQPASASSTRRRRSRGGRNRRKPSDATGTDATSTDAAPATDAFDANADSRQDAGESEPPTTRATQVEPAAAKKTTKKKAPAKSAASGAEKSAEKPPADSGGESKDSDDSGSSSRRRRRRRRSGDSTGDTQGDSAETVVKVREPRADSESITSVEGSTRIEAKKQRRREGREAGRRRAPILSESEFLARRESVDRVMVIRHRDDVTQIAVLEDNVLVEHYVALETQSSLIGNVYLGRVQNVLPSMEAAFIDIGKGRNAVLYAGEVNWDLIGDRNQPRRIENALKSGQQILVQVSKDPVGHKGARMTSQISLPGRYLVYVPGGGSSGISRKLPDTERNRLKNLLKDILPDESGVIIRTAAEGASEEELTRDVRRLTSRWDEIEKKVKGGKAPELLYAEPDITLKVVRDLFTEDFGKLVVSGDEAWETVNDYVSYVAPDLTERLERYDGDGDVFANYRVDEQIARALERKVWLPSGGSLVIDRTEAMTVVDVNTGKFTGSGGNLEQTVTKNNLEAAEEIVRQLRLRDIGGIIVIDFIDMVLENNRDLVLRRLVECLGRDRTRHQVAEVTSLGLVQMTRKRIGTGLVEAFSVPCEHCHGRGVTIEAEPVQGKSDEPSQTGRASSRRTSGRKRSSSKSEPEPDRIDPLATERHSAAAAATAAIAAALHPEARIDPPDPPEADQTDQRDLTDQIENADQKDRAEPVEPAPTKAPKTKRAIATKKPASAKKSTASKRSTAKKKADASSEPTLEPVGASS